MPLALTVALLLAAPDGGVRVRIPPLDLAETTQALTLKQRSGSGGTMHGNTSVTLSVDGGTPVALPGYAGDINAPNLNHVIALDGGWLLLGWSSGGSPYQTQELRTLNEALAQTGSFAWFTYRSERCVLLQRDATGWSVGVPPTTNEEAGLRIDDKRVKLVFTDFAMTPTTWSYCAPGREPFRAPRRVAWFRISAAGFQKP